MRKSSSTNPNLVVHATLIGVSAAGVFSLISAVLLILRAPDAKVEAFKELSAALMVVAQGALAGVITIVTTLQIRSGSAKTASSETYNHAEGEVN